MSGCRHYKRTCKLVSPCCGIVYTCRFCHDENEVHKLDRKAVRELVCTNCNFRQPVQTKCRRCNTYFGKYACLECRLFDDEFKKQFHCYGCGMCRTGGAENFFHCDKCNFCFPIITVTIHKCIENISGGCCPICLENMHTSRTPCLVLNCHHLLHEICYNQLKKSGHNFCPICKKPFPQDPN